MDINQDKIRLAAEEAALVFVKNYKYPLPDATEFFYQNMRADPVISKLISTSENARQLSKTALFREFLKKNKKELYYKIRKYKGSNESKQELMKAIENAGKEPTEEIRETLLKALAGFHISSQERFNENDVFYEQLGGLLKTADSIIDVGCGVQPLFFPQSKFHNLMHYRALDKDQQSVDIMNAFKSAFPRQYHWLQPQAWNISDGWTAIAGASDLQIFDVALLLKLVPVVRRTDPRLLSELMNVPAKRLIVSGVKESMVKKHDIEHKERKAITRFIADSGRTLSGEFELQNEFFLITD